MDAGPVAPSDHAYGIIGKPFKLWVMRFSDRHPRLGKILGALLRYELIFGVPGTKTQHYGKNYSFTEEFFTVYRVLHAMIRGKTVVRRLEKDSNGEVQDRVVGEIELADSNGFKTVKTLKEHSQKDLALTYGLESAGALVPNNMPLGLNRLTTQENLKKDLGVIDVVRPRERTPASSTYVDYVASLVERPPKTFLELTGDDAEMAAKLRS